MNRIVSIGKGLYILLFLLSWKFPIDFTKGTPLEDWWNVALGLISGKYDGAKVKLR